MRTLQLRDFNFERKLDKTEGKSIIFYAKSAVPSVKHAILIEYFAESFSTSRKRILPIIYIHYLKISTFGDIHTYTYISSQLFTVQDILYIVIKFCIKFFIHFEHDFK